MKQCNNKVTHFTEIFYLKQRQVDMLSLVYKKLNLCPVMTASRGFNPLATLKKTFFNTEEKKINSGLIL